MEIKWEKNSRVLAILGEGRIEAEDIIERTTTDNFPQEAATVRMQYVGSKSPWITIHIRGKGTQKTNSYNNYQWISAMTMRVNTGMQYKHYSVSGELDSELDFTIVDDIVKRVKAAVSSDSNLITTG